MKKKSRFLTGLLSAVMALSLFALPVAAGGEVGDESTQYPTIAANEMGSLTIYKYEGEKIETDAQGNETNLLDGVTFTAYKVADIKQDTTNGSVDVTYDPVDALKAVNSNIKITNKTIYNDIQADVENALKDTASPKLTEVTSETTGENGNKGEAVFNNLPVGVYLIVETDAPAQIVSKTANFLVTIPMMNDDGTGWNYDITVYPKNKSTYGGINLHKVGKVGQDGTESNLKDAKFYLQRYDSTSDTWVTVTKNDDGKWIDLDKSAADYNEKLENSLLTTDASGIITVEGLAPGKYRFVEAEAPNGYIVDGVTTYPFEIGEDGKPVVDKHKENDTTIKVVNEKPNLDKTVYNGSKYETDADYSVGDSVNWKITVDVPSNVDKLQTFVITDNMSEQLTWKSDKANVVVTTDPDAKLDKGTDYIITEPENDATAGKLKIEFTSDGKTKLKDVGTKTIEVTFNATLNEKAKVGVEGNLNDAKLTYSNAFYPTKDPTNPNNNKQPKEDEIKDQAIVYTFGLNVIKVDGSTNEKLDGAKFDLYLYTGTEDEPDLEELKENGKVVKHLVVKDGTIDVNGLENGTYYLVETKAPSYKVGEETRYYNLLKKPVKVEITATYETTTETTTTTDENGVTTTTTVITEKKINGSAEGYANYSITVKNNKGFDLPTTGGFGTLLFSCIGALLVVGGVGVLMSTKKKGNA